MNDANDLLPAEETDCAGCGKPVEQESVHTKFSVAFGRRRGRFHLGCMPLPSLESWMSAESERLGFPWPREQRTDSVPTPVAAHWTQ